MPSARCSRSSAWDWGAARRAGIRRCSPRQPTPVWLDLPRAAASRRLGETVLLAVLLASDGTRLTPEPVTLARAVDSLTAAGLDGDARAVAVEAALGAGL